jgi:hypothetical protein
MRDTLTSSRRTAFFTTDRTVTVFADDDRECVCATIPDAAGTRFRLLNVTA